MSNKREQIIKQWFGMWSMKTDTGIKDIFAEDAIYIESWSPEYHGAEKIKHWFDEWNTRGTVLKWDIKDFFHKEDQTIVLWHFECQMDGEEPNAFDGASLVKWAQDNRIAYLQEFGCNEHRYDPYRNGNEPEFESTKNMWF